jgi:hypothetical protein
MKSIHAALENLRAAQAKAKAEDRTNASSAAAPAPLPSRDWATAKTERAPGNEFEIWREAWSRQVLEDRQLSQRGKIVCWAIALRVNRTKRTAWPAGPCSIRRRECPATP